MLESKDEDRKSASNEFAALSPEGKELRRLNILLDLVKGLHSVADLEALLKKVVDDAIEITGAERGFLMLLENPVKLDHRLFDPIITPAPHSKPRMEFRVARTDAKKDLGQENFHISMTVAGRVAETGLPVWVRDAQGEAKLKSSDSVSNLDLRTILCVPLKDGQIVAGIIYVDSRFVMRTFSDEDRIMFEALSEHAARAIGRYRLHEESLQKTKIEKENAELRALDRKKSDFINMLAHEVRTPLTVIQGYSDRLQSGKVTDVAQVQNHATLIHNEALRLGRLVDELLDISRIKSGRQQIERVESDLAVLIERAVEAMKSRAQAKQLNLRLIFNKRPIVMALDPDKVYQLVLNLIDNAIKYTSKSGIIQVIADEIPTVEVQGDTFIAGFAQVSVSDTGIGIPPEDKEKVFDEFYRTDEALRMKEPGTGLGLSICRGIVQAHGGRIWVESQRGRGSKFIFTLPNYQSIEKLQTYK